MIVDDEYIPMLEALPFGRRIAIGSWAGQPSRRAFDDVRRSGDDVYMLYTGGTTGMPKGVMWRHEDFFYACCQGGDPLDPISEPDQIARNVSPTLRLDPLALGPLMHGGGQWLTLTGLFCGGKAIVYCERSFDAEQVLDLVAAEKPTAIGIIGDAMARPLAEAVLAEPDRWDLSAVVTLGNGGAMLSSAVKTQLSEAFPTALLLDSFGASETGAAGSEIGADPRSSRPAFSTDGRTWVLDPDTLDKLEPGSGSEGLLARRGHIPIGYWNDEAKTAATFRTDADGVRWVLPGDWATIDSDNRIILFGRRSGWINTGGEKVFPEEVEAALRAHPDVLDAVVVGAPDERMGESVVALIELRPGAGRIELDQLQEHCRAAIAGYKVPRRVLFGPAPRTNVGKPDYAAARALVSASMVTDNEARGEHQPRPVDPNS